MKADEAFLQAPTAYRVMSSFEKFYEYIRKREICVDSQERFIIAHIRRMKYLEAI